MGVEILHSENHKFLVERAGGWRSSGRKDVRERDRLHLVAHSKSWVNCPAFRVLGAPLKTGQLSSGGSFQHSPCIVDGADSKVEIRVTVLGGLLLDALAVIVIIFISGGLLVVFGVLAGIGIGTVWTNSDALVSDLTGGGRLGASMRVLLFRKQVCRECSRDHVTKSSTT